MSEAIDNEAIRSALALGGPVFVRWRPAVAEAFPEIAAAIERFNPKDIPAAHACTDWLRSFSLTEPEESATRLLLSDGELLGFYALSNGQAELTQRDRESLHVHRRTQPAILLTQIARAAGEPSGTGRALVVHAIGKAREARNLSAATILALDPHDERTSRMWQETYAFRPSETNSPGSKTLRRLWQPLDSD